VGTPIPAVIEPFDPVFIKFNLPIQPSANAIVVDEDGVAKPAPTVTVDGDTLELAFSGLAAGEEYNLTVHVVAKVGDRLVEADFWAPFFTVPIAGEVQATVNRIDPQTIDITFSEPVGTGNTAYNNMGGSNCVLFYNADINGGGVIGDSSSEIGHTQCDAGGPLYQIEPDPLGPVGLSGFTTKWRFTVPSTAGGPIAPGVAVHILFSRINDPAYRMQRVDGTPVTDFTDTRLIFLN
jgi:hypothetical protein